MNHIVLTDVKKGAKVDGARVEFLGGFVNMTVNKNVIPGNVYLPTIQKAAYLVNWSAC